MSEHAVPVVLITGVLIVFGLIAATYLAVRTDVTLTPEQTAKILSWIRWYGPLGVLQLLMFTYLPGSKFGGH